MGRRYIICTSCFVLFICLIAQGCTNLFFVPMRPHVLTPEAANLEYEDMYIESSDGVILHAWFLPAITEAKGTVFFLHGNAQNISTHLGSVYWLPAEGFNVLIWDYRGFGKSAGEPSFPGVIYDVESALSALIERRDIDPSKVIVFGQSLGGALAIYAVAHSAHRDNIKAVIIDSAFSGYRAIAREKLSDIWLTWPLQWPLSLLFMDSYNPLESIAVVSPLPTLFIYSENDKVIPAHHGELLFKAAKEPKEKWVLKTEKHIQSTNSQAIRKRLVKYMERKLKIDSE